MNLRLDGRSAACRRLEKVEVAAEIGLLHVLRVEEPEAPLELRRRWEPPGAASSELLVAHEEVEAARRHVQADEISIAHEGERPADVRLRRDVQHTRAIARSAHPR